jgi:CheY-like chemotaxis protein/CheY-specific phosphatase CheX
MSVTQLHIKILDPFIDETVKAIEKMTGLTATPGEAFIDQVDKFSFKGYAMAAETTGKINGVILMHHYIETALDIGNMVRQKLLGITTTEDQITQDLIEALTEWCNTSIGRATRVLAESNLGIRFKPPYFISDTGMMRDVLEGVKEIISVPIHIENLGRFYFNYLIKASGAERRNAISQHEKIMVVDDMKMIRDSLKRYLKILGYENVVEAADGEEAIIMHAKERPAMVFMDVVMPKMTGNTALARIRSTGSQTPIVMLSSVADQELIRECERHGISGYIVKPLTMETGPDVLKTFLTGENNASTDSNASTHHLAETVD